MACVVKGGLKWWTSWQLGLLAEKVPTASVLARLVLVTCKPFLSGPCLLVGYQGMVTCDMEPQLLNSVRCGVCCYTVAAEHPSVNKSQLGGKCAAVLTWTMQRCIVNPHCIAGSGWALRALR